MLLTQTQVQIYHKTSLALRNSSALQPEYQMMSENRNSSKQTKLYECNLSLSTCLTCCGIPWDSCLSDFWKNKLESFRFLVTDVVLGLHCDDCKMLRAKLLNLFKCISCAIAYTSNWLDFHSWTEKQTKLFHNFSIDLQDFPLHNRVRREEKNVWYERKLVAHRTERKQRNIVMRDCAMAWYLIHWAINRSNEISSQMIQNKYLVT